MRDNTTPDSFFFFFSLKRAAAKFLKEVEE